MFSLLKVKIIIWLHKKLGEVLERLIEIRTSWKLLLKGISFPSLQKFVENKKFQSWKLSWKLTEREGHGMGKILFKPWGLNCHLKVMHFLVLCLWCVHEIWDLNDSGFQSGGKQPERTEGHNTHQNWGRVQDLSSLDAQARRQKWDTLYFWKLACFLFEVFPQSNSRPTNSHHPPKNKQKTKQMNNPLTLHTHKTPKTTKNPTKAQTLGEFLNPLTSLLHFVAWGRMGFLK